MQEFTTLRPERLVARERVVDPDTLDWQIHEYLLALRVTRKPKTVEHARQYLCKFANWCQQHGITKVQELTRNHLREWQLHLLEQYRSRHTVWSINCDLRAFLNWCVREEILPAPIYKQGDFIAKPRPQPKPLSLDDVQKLLSALEGSGWMVARDRAIVTTLLYTGARRGELLQMRVGDLDQQSFMIMQKGDRPHVIHLDEEVLVLIHRYLRLYVRQTGHRLGKDDLLWRSPGRRPLTANGLRLAMVRLSKRSGIDVWCHRLRATSATLRLALGAPTEAVRAQLGHSDLRSVEHYLKLAQNDLRRILKETSPLQLLRDR